MNGSEALVMGKDGPVSQDRKGDRVSIPLPSANCQGHPSNHRLAAGSATLETSPAVTLVRESPFPLNGRGR